MLIRFEVENFRSIREPVELSMVAIDEDRESARLQERIGVALLTTAGVFGPNASGKSNVLAALGWLSDAVASSLRQWDESIPIEPFAFGDSENRDSSFALELSVDGVRFEYLLDLNAEHVSYEALFHYPEGRRRRVFEREGNDLVLQRGLGALSGTRALLTDRSLALTIMRRFDEPLVNGFANQLVHISSLGQQGAARNRLALSRVRQATIRIFGGHRQEQLSLFEDESTPNSGTTRARALSLLRLADLGVVDVEIDESTIEAPSGATYTKRNPRLIHSAGAQRVPFEYMDESEGTRTWFNLIGPLLSALERGAIVLFDELDASLHPTLTAQLVRLFQNNSSNPNGAQLVFASHDTNLLNHLNRDEIWLTQKDESGQTRFGALSDFAGKRVQKSQNIETGYLSGRFGALPDTSNPEVLRSLGLIG